MSKFFSDCDAQSWEAVDCASSNFTPDITPLILAAHTNNYEILKILLDRGATLPMPHDVRWEHATSNKLLAAQPDRLKPG
jgi:ankyrin repeat protein